MFLKIFDDHPLIQEVAWDRFAESASRQQALLSPLSYERDPIPIAIFIIRTDEDVKETLDQALSKTGLRQVKVKHRARLLSDNGPCYISKELGDYLDKLQIRHTREALYYSMTQGKIERYHRSLKNVINLDNYYFLLELEREIAKFADDYNHERNRIVLENRSLFR